MADWRVWIVHCRRPMHECGRTKRWFTRIPEIDVSAQIVIEFPREAEREFVEEIVRMLPVMQWFSVPRFAALKEKGITAPAFGQRIETHHQARAELGRIAERMRIHRHEPIRRIDPIIAAPRAHIRVTREN